MRVKIFTMECIEITFFDCVNSKPSLFRHQKDDISKLNAPLCGVPGVHKFFCTNESDILTEHRGGY